MNKMAASAGLLLGLAMLASSARAEIGALDPTPAATLLLPYFEVDLDDPTGPTTLFTINNATAEPAIAHVTLWTDLSVPTLDFNVFLTGYDVVTFNMRDLFFAGITPQTSHQQTAISPVGSFSVVTNPVSGVGPGSTSCDGQLPLPPLPAILLDHIRASHTGQPSAVFAGRCSGKGHSDGLARGYLTIDNVNFCTLDFPGDAGYFISGGQGAANNLNQLWGDFVLLSDRENGAQGLPLVHLEADDALGPANYTFYRRYSGGADQREGLATTWAARFGIGGLFDGGTRLLIWRDSKRRISPFFCGITPAPFPLSANNLTIFDEDENFLFYELPPFSPSLPAAGIVPFPWETQSVDIEGTFTDPFLGFPFEFGWLYMNLNNPVAGSQVPFEPLMQNWVGVLMQADGRFSVGFEAVHFDGVTDPGDAQDEQIPVCDGDPDPAYCE